MNEQNNQEPMTQTNMSNDPTLDSGMEEIKEKVEEVAEKMVEFAKDTKEKYDSATPETKEKIKKSVIGGATALLAIIGLKKLFSKKN